MSKILDNPIIVAFGSATGALLVYGAWGYFANAQHGNHAALHAAITQGSYSCAITLVLAYCMELIFHKLPASRFRLPIALIIVSTLLYLTSWGVNKWRGTPEIFMTIVPGAAIGTLYGFFYLFNLQRKLKNIAQNAT